ncbi:hypothetical protein DPEC_G00138050 [Dallia pectoralis]|uniref:Uncharacterized protein n=1 Tax=Dallia pectoralis TaxID=75939 RepID=A0ACC2GLW6_DALPE|nr:hypothetical protein DPEC_G00138050 [Dallia pectoralis]
MRCHFPCQEDEIVPVKFDEESLVWVASDQPLKNCSFLSSKILDPCRDLLIFWLHPRHPKDLTALPLSHWLLTQYPSPLWLPGADGERGRRDTQRAERQSDIEGFEPAKRGEWRIPPHIEPCRRRDGAMITWASAAQSADAGTPGAKGTANLWAAIGPGRATAEAAMWRAT